MNIEVGQSYNAEELADLCGFDIENVRYETYVFSGDKAEVICQDEGNGVVKVLEIRRQSSEIRKHSPTPITLPSPESVCDWARL